MMTINQFAERCGLTPGTLRFYESKGILRPALRRENGYRLYSEEQLPDAYLITSLRHAGIGLEEIRHFLTTAAPAEREERLERWREEIASRLLSLQVAQSYLSGISADRRDIHLVRWEEPISLLWFSLSVPGGPAPFAVPIRERRAQLKAMGIRIGPESYIRTQGRTEPVISGQLGFVIEPRQLERPGPLPPDATVEQVPPSLFAALDLPFDDIYSRFRINRFLRDFGLEAVGAQLERHVLGQESSYLVMIPVRRRTSAP